MEHIELDDMPDWIVRACSTTIVIPPNDLILTISPINKHIQPLAEDTRGR